MGWLSAALWFAVAVVVIVMGGPEHLSRKHKKQMLALPEDATPPPRAI